MYYFWKKAKLQVHYHATTTGNYNQYTTFRQISQSFKKTFFINIKTGKIKQNKTNIKVWGSWWNCSNDRRLRTSTQRVLQKPR